MDHLTELYCLMDDFCKEFQSALKAKRITDGKGHRDPPTNLSMHKLQMQQIELET